MEKPYQPSEAEMKTIRKSWNSAAPYFIGTILPVPIIMLAGSVILIIQGGRLSDPGFVCAWIASIAVGLVCSLQSCRLAPDPSIRLLGGIFFVLYLLGAWSLLILNR